MTLDNLDRLFLWLAFFLLAADCGMAAWQTYQLAMVCR